MFWALVLLFPLGRFLEKTFPSPLSVFVVWTGSVYLAFMLYAFLLVLTYDLYRLLIYIIPALSIPVSTSAKLLTVSASALLILLVIAVGYFNARRPILTEIDIPAPVEKTYRLAFVSDVHLGTISGKKQLERIVRHIKEAGPDLILFGGDVFDEDPGPVIQKQTGQSLLTLKAPLGVYAVTGNHEYIGGAESAISYMEQSGIRVLRDEWILIDSAFILSGREDRDKSRFTGVSRKAIGELLKELPERFPTLLVDHQPFDYHEIQSAGVFLSVSGHTHYGQLWPLNYITNLVFENSFGLIKKGNTFFYVSCGAGTWGPPVRTSSRPEVVLFTLSPDGSLQ